MIFRVKMSHVAERGVFSSAMTEEKNRRVRGGTGLGGSWSRWGDHVGGCGTAVPGRPQRVGPEVNDGPGRGS